MADDRYCTKCGNLLSNDMLYCPSCGSKNAPMEPGAREKLDAQDDSVTVREEDNTDVSNVKTASEGESAPLVSEKKKGFLAEHKMSVLFGAIGIVVIIALVGGINALANPTSDIAGSWYLYTGSSKVSVIKIQPNGTCKIYFGPNEELGLGEFTGSGRCSKSGNTVTFTWEKVKNGTKSSSTDTGTVSSDGSVMYYGTNVYYKSESQARVAAKK